tara:strand:- start:14 stop:187 length:174 start_codon:yes stop_codon:yes gene_type:complete
LILENLKYKMNKQLTQQNFQGEVISGYVMHLIKLTLENIRLGKQKQLKLTKGKYETI